MMPSITEEQLNRISFIIENGFTVPCNDYDYEDIFQYKLSFAATLLLYKETGLIIDDFEFETEDYYGERDLESLLSSFYLSLPVFGDQLLGNILSILGWKANNDFFEIKSDQDDFDWETFQKDNDYGEMELVVIYNKEWAIFFDYIRKNGCNQVDILEKIKEHLPCDFLQYFYCWDKCSSYPEYGYYRHVLGYDGGEHELTSGAACIYFPLACLVVEYYMHKIIDLNPGLKEVMMNAH